MNTNNLSTLRKHITPFYGDHLPEQIRYRDRAGREVVIPTHTATLDELAFAIQMASEEQSLASRRRAALDELYLNARKSGAIGSDCLSDISWKEMVWTPPPQGRTD